MAFVFGFGSAFVWVCVGLCLMGLETGFRLILLECCAYRSRVGFSFGLVPACSDIGLVWTCFCLSWVVVGDGLVVVSTSF